MALKSSEIGGSDNASILSGLHFGKVNDIALKILGSPEMLKLKAELGRRIEARFSKQCSETSDTVGTMVQLRNEKQIASIVELCLNAIQAQLKPKIALGNSKLSKELESLCLQIVPPVTKLIAGFVELCYANSGAILYYGTLAAVVVAVAGIVATAVWAALKITNSSDTDDGNKE
ncbi:unnamed protein product, partial [Mesorhabditis spiculigera]